MCVYVYIYVYGFHFLEFSNFTSISLKYQCCMTSVISNFIYFFLSNDRKPLKEGVDPAVCV